MLEKKSFYINGKWVSPSKTNDFKVINPSNEDAFAVISLGNAEDTNSAVESAKKAFVKWKETSKEERISLLESVSIEALFFCPLAFKKAIHVMRFSTIKQGKNADFARSYVPIKE